MGSSTTETCWTNYPLCKAHMDIPYKRGYNTPQLAAETFPNPAIWNPPAPAGVGMRRTSREVALL